MTAQNMQEIVKNAKLAMDKAVENTRREFATIRTGKATTSPQTIRFRDTFTSRT